MPTPQELERQRRAIVQAHIDADRTADRVAAVMTLGLAPAFDRLANKVIGIPSKPLFRRR